MVKLTKIVQKKKSCDCYCPKLREKFPTLLILQYKTIKAYICYINKTIILQKTIANRKN